MLPPLRPLVAVLWLAGPEPSGDAVDLAWAGPSACPSADSGRERVEGFLGEPLATASERGPLEIEVSIRAVSAGFEAVIRFAEDDSSRALVDADCEVLTDAAAFIVASNVDPQAGEPEPEPEPEPELLAPTVLEPEPEPEPEPESNPEPPVAAADRVRRHVQVAASMFASLRPMLATGVGPGGGLRVAALYGRARFELEGFGAVGQRHFVPDTATSLRASVVGGALRGCFAAVARPRVELPVCAGFEAAGVEAHALEGVLEPRTDWQPWLAVLIGAGAIWRVHPRVGLGAGVDFAAALRRPAFTVVNQGTAYQPFPVALTPWIGLELRSR